MNEYFEADGSRSITLALRWTSFAYLANNARNILPVLPEGDEGLFLPVRGQMYGKHVCTPLVKVTYFKESTN